MQNVNTTTADDTIVRPSKVHACISPCMMPGPPCYVTARPGRVLTSGLGDEEGEAATHGNTGFAHDSNDSTGVIMTHSPYLSVASNLFCTVLYFQKRSMSCK